MDVFTAAVPPFMKNGYLVVSEDDAVLIDPGDEIDQLVDAARARGLRPHAILLTHAHLDHITGIRRAKAAFDIPVWLHREDLFLYDRIVEQGRMFGLECEPQPPVDHFYTPGEPLTFGRLRVDVHETPGHCPGGVCLVIGDGTDSHLSLFVGDTLFAGSIGRSDFPGGDYETLMASIRGVLLAFADDSVVYAGHGPATTIGEERRTNPFLTEG